MYGNLPNSNPGYYSYPSTAYNSGYDTTSTPVVGASSGMMMTPYGQHKPHQGSNTPVNTHSQVQHSMGSGAASGLYYGPPAALMTPWYGDSGAVIVGGTTYYNACPAPPGSPYAQLISQQQQQQQQIMATEHMTPLYSTANNPMPGSPAPHHFYPNDSHHLHSEGPYNPYSIPPGPGSPVAHGGTAGGSDTPNYQQQSSRYHWQDKEADQQRSPSVPASKKQFYGRYNQQQQQQQEEKGSAWLKRMDPNYPNYPNQQHQPGGGDHMEPHQQLLQKEHHDPASCHQDHQEGVAANNPPPTVVDCMQAEVPDTMNPSRAPVVHHQLVHNTQEICGEPAHL
ncbi:hypothetical protein CEUSTIGMA_g1091.t1 [Chlamydomonas eustigma]|uniref:Uncharacterized protein n=1 Tax=Chlamydomonas eustigma TaxID=1157962 RepID=A0A250WSY7_9CHLO|nr:hypothetical protein CEUSTIGMA_g1091.t1 [Chlamydomonas eustigma]|eukprot:GAX73640.1 hypothetical protein CEUSTIGMA_g1091.t1 [Chlamydomonas eustigma]